MLLTILAVHHDTRAQLMGQNHQQKEDYGDAGIDGPEKTVLLLCKHCEIYW